jgi:hypothetical protein
LMYSPLSAYFDDVIPQQPALSNDGKQRQPALGDFNSPIGHFWLTFCFFRDFLTISAIFGDFFT